MLQNLYYSNYNDEAKYNNSLAHVKSLDELVYRDTLYIRNVFHENLNLYGNFFYSK